MQPLKIIVSTLLILMREKSQVPKKESDLCRELELPVRIESSSLILSLPQSSSFPTHSYRVPQFAAD